MRGRKKICVFEFDPSTRELKLQSSSPGVTFSVINDYRKEFKTILAQMDKVTIEVPLSGAPQVTICPDNVRIHFVKPGEAYAPAKEEEDGTDGS